MHARTSGRRCRRKGDSRHQIRSSTMRGIRRAQIWICHVKWVVTLSYSSKKQWYFKILSIQIWSLKFETWTPPLQKKKEKRVKIEQNILWKGDSRHQIHFSMMHRIRKAQFWICHLKWVVSLSYIVQWNKRSWNFGTWICKWFPALYMETWTCNYT